MQSSLCCRFFFFVTVVVCSFTIGAFGTQETGDVSPPKCPDSISTNGSSFTLSRGYDHGSVLRFNCPEGFYPYPIKLHRCLYGKWDPKPNQRSSDCRKVTCPDPNVLENGVVTPKKRQYFVNDTTSYRCHSGYDFRGSSTRVCQTNGKWSGGTPICSHYSDFCPDPGVPPGASRAGHVFNNGSKVTYHCDNRLTLVGSKVRVCQKNKQWSGQEPACYADFTYDTPEEVAEAFGRSLKTTLVEYEEIENVNGDIKFGRKVRVDQGGKLDIYIALDASGSIEEQDFEESKEIVITLLKRISNYQVTPNYEILIFATDVTHIVKIRDTKRHDNPETLDAVINDLKNFDYDVRGEKTGTNIAKAYRTILESISFEKDADKYFPETQHVIIMFTDGKANMGGNPTPYVDKIKAIVFDDKLDERDRYLDLYVFGVGDDVRVEGIADWVTKRSHERHFFLLTDKQALKKSLDDMIDEGTSVGLCGLYKDFDGTETEIRRRHPWLIKIDVKHQNGKVSKCSGSLVTPQFILTAAHCFKFDDEVDNIYLETPNYRESFKVKDFFLHPKFKVRGKKEEGISEYYEYDVALIELETSIITTAELRPICIPCTHETSGALKLSSSDVTCKHHKEAMMNVDLVKAFFMSQKREKTIKQDVEIKQGHKRDVCISDTEKALNITAEKAKTITENFLCTGGIEVNYVDAFTCKGDAGGATFVEQSNRVIQVGVVSWSLKDLCSLPKNKLLKERESARDFHIDLFHPDVQSFLKKYLGDGDRGAPLTFL